MLYFNHGAGVKFRSQKLYINWTNHRRFFLKIVCAPPLDYNLGHNNLELYNILVHVRFTTSKMKLDI